MCVTPVMKTEHNIKIQGTGAVQNIHQYSVDMSAHAKSLLCIKATWEPVMKGNGSLRELFTCKQMSGALELKHILVLSS